MEQAWSDWYAISLAEIWSRTMAFAAARHDATLAAAAEAEQVEAVSPASPSVESSPSPFPSVSSSIPSVATSPPVTTPVLLAPVSPKSPFVPSPSRIPRLVSSPSRSSSPRSTASSPSPRSVSSASTLPFSPTRSVIPGRSPAPPVPEALPGPARHYGEAASTLLVSGPSAAGGLPAPCSPDQASAVRPSNRPRYVSSSLCLCLPHSAHARSPSRPVDLDLTISPTPSAAPNALSSTAQGQCLPLLRAGHVALLTVSIAPSPPRLADPQALGRHPQAPSSSLQALKPQVCPSAHFSAPHSHHSADLIVYALSRPAARSPQSRPFPSSSLKMSSEPFFDSFVRLCSRSPSPLRSDADLVARSLARSPVPAPGSPEVLERARPRPARLGRPGPLDWAIGRVGSWPASSSFVGEGRRPIRKAAPSNTAKDDDGQRACEKRKGLREI